MNIVFFGYDYTLDIAQRLIADGHNIAQIFTFPCDNHFAFNRDISDYANMKNIPITDEVVNSNHINILLERGCDLFICAGYPHKIPQIDPERARGLNVHPTALPRARGIMPLPFVIMDEPEAAGFTIHKLSPQFDTGDILYQEKINIDAYTDIETLSARIALRCPGAVSETIAKLDERWENATPQSEENSSEYPAPGDVLRKLEWTEDAAALNRKARAFGRFGTIATVQNIAGNSQTLGVFNFSAWKEETPYAPGTLIRSSEREVIIAIKDGFVCLKEFQVLPT